MGGTTNTHVEEKTSEPNAIVQNIHQTDEFIQKIAKSFEQTKTLLSRINN